MTANTTHYRFIFVMLFLFMFPFAGMYALDVKDFTFRHFGTQEGMVSQRVYSICQTVDGAVWWTTKGGVDRTNGALVKNYQVGEKKLYSSFAGRTVKIAHTVKNSFDTGKHRLTSIDSLYVFDNTGKIFRYDAIQDRFDEVYRMSDLMKKEIILNDVFVDHDCIWLAMREGIYRLKDGKLKALHKGVYSNYIIRTKTGLLFCTTKGLYNQSSVVIPRLNVECGYYDQQYNKVWLGTLDGGVKVLDASLKGIAHDLNASVPSNPVRSITPYDSHTMLIGVDGFGVYEVARNRPGNASLLFDANEGSHGVLHGNGIYAVFVDTWGNIIVGSFSGGIDIARPGDALSTVFRHVRNNMQTLINDHVNSVMQASKDMLLFGTDDGISMYDMTNKQWRHVGRGLVVLDMCRTTDGRILAATYGKGVCEIDRDGNARQIYSVSNGTLKDDHVVELMYDRKGNLWIGSLYGELVEKTPHGFSHYNIKNVQSMEQLADGRIVVGTFNGVFIVSTETGKISELLYQSPNSDDANKYVFDLYVGKSNDLWIATDGGGVYVYNLKTHGCRQITTEEGLPSNSVCSITEDGDGRIWLGTENGLAFVCPWKSYEVINVNHSRDLQKEYMRSAVCNLVNGNVLFGTGAGSVIVNPKHLRQLHYASRLRIMKVSCKDDDNDLFHAQMHKMLADNKLWLGYSQRTFEIFYETINLRYADDIAYQYKIGKGEWSQPTNMQRMRFENLEPGTHKMSLRCVSRVSNRVLDEIELKIIINQPWWNSWWMWCVYLLLLVLAFYGAWRVYDLHTKYMRFVVGNVNDDVQADSCKEEPDATGRNNDSGKEFVDMATKIILNHISDTDFTIDKLCSEMAMSRTLFYVKLKSYTGKSPQDFIRVIRLERAAALLRSGRSVTDVSMLIGFDNPKYFSTVFKKYFGMSPSKYK